MNKVVFYLRVSTKDQAKEGYSLEVQKEYLESFAKKKVSKFLEFELNEPFESLAVGSEIGSEA